MHSCPNINLSEWKDLVKVVGLKEAARDYIETSLIRTPEEVSSKLVKRGSTNDYFHFLQKDEDTYTDLQRQEYKGIESKHIPIDSVEMKTTPMVIEIKTDKLTLFKKEIKFAKKVSNSRMQGIISRVKAANIKLTKDLGKRVAFIVRGKQVGQMDLFDLTITDLAPEVAEPIVKAPKPEQTSMFYTEGMPGELNLNQEVMDNTRAKEIIQKLVDRLSLQANTPYRFIPKSEALNIDPTWKGQPAFYNGGVVYFVGDLLNTSIAFHEFSHPIIRTIARSNPKLFNNLYAKLESSPEGQEIIQGLRDNYKQLIEGTPEFMEEALVFSFQRASENKSNELANSTPFQKFLKDLLYAIKQGLRGMFGKIKIEGLSPNTTVNELAEMLAHGGNFDIKAEVVSDKDVTSYYQEIKDEIETLKKLEVNDLQAMISEGKLRASNMLYDIANSNDKAKYEGLLKAITDVTGANELEQVANTLRNYAVNPKKEFEWKAKLAELQADVDMVNQHSEAMVNSLKKLENTAQHITDHITILAKDPNNKDYLNQVTLYEKHIDYFVNYLSNEHNKNSIISILNKSNTPSDNKLYTLASNISNTFKQGKKQIEKIKYNATIDLAVSILTPMKEWTNEYYKDLIEKLEKKGAKAEVEKMKRERDLMLQPLTNMDDTLQGFLGNGQMANNFVEGFLYSQDPVVETLAKYITDNYIDVITESQRKANIFMKAVFPLMEKAGISHIDIGSIGEKVGDKDKIYNDEDPSKPIEVWTLLSEFKDTRYYKAEFQNKIEKLQEEADTTGDYSKVIEEEIKMEEHISKYFHRKYKPEFYERFKLFQDDIGREGLKRLKNWQRKMELFNTRYDASFELPGPVQEQQYEALMEEYKFMYSMFAMNNGSFQKKDEKEQAITQRLREYREKTRKFYFQEQKPGLFQLKLKEYENTLLSRDDIKGDRDSEIFKLARTEWIEKNTQKKLNSIWEALVKRAYTRIAEISKKVAGAPEFEKLHGEITDICNLNRDEAGIVDAMDMSPKMMEKVWVNQERLNLIQKNPQKYAALTSDEKDELFGLFEFLEQYSIRKPSDYYLTVFNNHLKIQQDSVKQMFKNSIGDVELTRENANRFLMNSKLVKVIISKDPDFQSWFHKNHIVKETYNKRTEQREPQWTRLRPWDMTLPTSDEYYEKTEIKDDTGKVIEEINGIPSRKYYRSVVIGNADLGTGWFTKQIIGETVTNRRQRNGEPEWLPKGVEDAPEDSPYINKDYLRLKAADPNSQDGKIFTLLEGLKTQFLKFQEGTTNDVKLWLDFPMFEKSNLEVLSAAAKKGEPLSPITTWAKEFRARFSSNSDNVDQGFNLTRDMQSISNIVKLDLFDSTVKYRIPMSGIYQMEIDRVSTDLPLSMIRYMAAMEMNQTLLKISPFVRGLQDTVNNSEGIAKDITASNYNNRVVLNAKNKKGDAVRKETVNAIIAKYFEGQNVEGFGKDVKWIHGVSGTIFNIASTGFFALNLPSALKNTLGLHFQSTLEAFAGVKYDMVDMGKGTMWSIKTTSEISMAVYNRDVKSVDIQLVEIMDPEAGRLLSAHNFKLGEQTSRTLMKDVLSFSWLLNARNWLQLESSLSVLGAIMNHNKVKQTIDGVEREIPYIEAWTLDDQGQITLKPGIDKEYAQGGKEFKKIVNLQHDMNRSLQGAYSHMEQAEMNRYLIWKWLSYLKKYFVTMFMERFAFRGGTELLPRYNVATGELKQGYYITALKNFIRAIKGANLNLLILNDTDKRAFIKLVAEVGMIIGMGILYEVLFGFDPDDPDKYEKLRKKSGALPTPLTVNDPEHPFHMDGFLANHALLLMMQIKAENDQFLPIPGLGLENYDQMLTLKSYALGPTIDSWTQVMSDITAMAAGKESAYYKRQVGPYNWQQEGHAKIVNHAAKSVGFTGTQMDPILGIQHAVTAQQNPRRGG